MALKEGLSQVQAVKVTRHTLLYGGGDELDLSKLRDVAEGLETYSASTASVGSSRGTSGEGRAAAAEQIASVVLAENGNYVQVRREPSFFPLSSPTGFV